jgi:CDP-glycerol glycerophosphotransferase
MDIDAIKKCSNIHAVMNNGDIYEELYKFDVLITDFSGIYFDFLITGKPIIMAPFNLDEYISQDRSLYYDYESICPSAPVRNWQELFCVLADIKNGEITQGEMYAHLRSRFHKNLDSLSSKRAIDAIRFIL